ncbi:MAG: hypothetical protein HUJ65_01635, partial [Oscillospiraceae bacterium]|nr:hypothetical protein [Oscillospiraceae bacterium]
MKKKIIAVLLVVIMLASMGTPVLAETTETTNYDVWVGGVQVTSANKDNVLGDDGTPTVTYTPATETDWAKLT